MRQLELNYYKVTAVRGHVGAGKGADIVFAVKAPNASSAMRIVKSMPAVKHKSASVRSVELITRDEFIKLRAESAYHRR